MDSFNASHPDPEPSLPFAALRMTHLPTGL
jgi:hypothetical protein